jgi:flagellar hook-associated protein 3 FlgL
MLSSNIALQGLVSSLDSLNQQQTTISQQMSTGVRITALSDDPTAVANATQQASSLDQAASFIATANTVGNRMQAADSALSQVVTTLTSAISTAVGALSQGVDATAKSTAAAQISSARDTLLSLANSSYNGQYLFSGSGTTQPFTQAADGSVTYTGSAQVSGVALISGGTLPTSIAGSSIFTASGASVFNALNDLLGQLQSSSTPDAATSAALVGNLRNALSNLTTQRAAFNTVQARLSSESDYATSIKTNFTVNQSTLLGADTASLATQLSQVTTQRNALLSTIGIVQKGTLFDYL